MASELSGAAVACRLLRARPRTAHAPACHCTATCTTMWRRNAHRRADRLLPQFYKTRVAGSIPGSRHLSWLLPFSLPLLWFVAPGLSCARPPASSLVGPVLTPAAAQLQLMPSPGGAGWEQHTACLQYLSLRGNRYHHQVACWRASILAGAPVAARARAAGGLAGGACPPPSPPNAAKTYLPHQHLLSYRSRRLFLSATSGAHIWA